MTDNSNRFKKGDRVRWTGAYDPTVAHVSAKGQLGTVTKASTQEITEIEWDIGNNVASNEHGLGWGIYNGNLELIDMIDIAKPLVVTRTAAGPYNVTFVTETSDGGILVSVDRDQSLTDGWFIFDKQGKFVRSSDGEGERFVLSNKPQLDTTIFGVFSSTGDLIGRKLRRNKTPNIGTAEFQVGFRRDKEGRVIDAYIVTAVRDTSYGKTLDASLKD